jgi:hypothetical protein
VQTRWFQSIRSHKLPFIYEVSNTKCDKCWSQSSWRRVADYSLSLPKSIVMKWSCSFRSHPHGWLLTLYWVARPFSCFLDCALSVMTVIKNWVRTNVIINEGSHLTDPSLLCMFCSLFNDAVSIQTIWRRIKLDYWIIIWKELGSDRVSI